MSCYELRRAGSVDCHSCAREPKREGDSTSRGADLRSMARLNGSRNNLNRGRKHSHVNSEPSVRRALRFNYLARQLKQQEILRISSASLESIYSETASIVYYKWHLQKRPIRCRRWLRRTVPPMQRNTGRSYQRIGYEASQIGRAQSCARQMELESESLSGLSRKWRPGPVFCEWRFSLFWPPLLHTADRTHNRTRLSIAAIISFVSQLNYSRQG